MSDVGLERRAFYLIESHGRVVQVIDWTETTLSIIDPETRERWTIRRAPFEERLQDDRIERVRPHWRTVGGASA